MVKEELAEYDPALAAVPMVVVANKSDLLRKEGADVQQETLDLLREEAGTDIFVVSALEGTEDSSVMMSLREELAQRVLGAPLLPTSKD